jgi:hypothetical protein
MERLAQLSFLAIAFRMRHPTYLTQIEQHPVQLFLLAIFHQLKLMND